MRLKLWSLAVALILFLGVPAQAQTCSNLVTAVPATISAPGTYCFNGSLNTSASFTSGCAVTISAASVTLDLAGSRLGTAAPMADSSAIGICVEDKANVTIRNGSVRGYHKGIHVKNTAGNAAAIRIERFAVSHCNHTGLLVEGRATLYQVQVDDIKAHDSYPGTDLDAFGIVIGGDSSVVESDVASVIPRGAGLGVAVDFLAGGLAQRLRLFGAPMGLRFSSSAPGKYADVLTRNVTTPFSVDGIAVGGANN